MTTQPTANWQLSPIVCNARGNKSAQILCANSTGGNLIKVRLGPTKAPFGAGLFTQSADATRLNLDLQCSENYVIFFDAVDEWAIGRLAERSTDYFKKSMTKDEIKQLFKTSATPIAKMELTISQLVARK